MKNGILIKERSKKIIETEWKIKVAIKELYDFLHENVDTYEELETEIKRSASDMQWMGSNLEGDYLLKSMKSILEKEKRGLPLQR